MYSHVGETIWNDLARLASDKRRQKDPPDGIYVWTPRDRPPAEVKKGETRVGRVPRVSHLREGYFYPLRPVYRTLVREILDWIDTRPASTDRDHRIPVFWIGGRSGCGKSVALLHVLAGLHDDGVGPILWLGGKVNRLPEAMTWARRVGRPRAPAIIGIDDPYAPAARLEAAKKWTEALARFEADRDREELTDGSHDTVVVVCCGPTEQALRMCADLEQDVLIRTGAMPLDREDLEGIWQWFARRTDRDDVPPLPVQEGDTLLVQYIYQWEEGKTLDKVAESFRSRTRGPLGDGGELMARFSRLLMLNRLYVGYPADALKQIADRNRVLQTMLDEGHLVADRGNFLGKDATTKGQAADAGRVLLEGSVWLAHPHLAGKIYDAWYGNDLLAGPTHLSHGISDALEFGRTPDDQMAPLLALARLVPEEQVGVLAPGIVRDVVRDVYRRCMPAPEQIPLEYLPVWLRAFGHVP